jgi:hypothetical protein
MSKDKNAEKADSEKTKKTAGELATLHVAKLEHSVARVEMWTDKVAKILKSKRHPMTDAQKGDTLDYMEKVRQDFVDALTAPEKVQKSGFRLKR